MKKIFILFISLLIAGVSHTQTVKALWNVCGDDIHPTPTDMAVDHAGNSYVTGYVPDTVTNDYQLHHFFLQKTSVGGVVQWTRYYPVADSFDAGRAVATDNSGNVYVTGERYDTACNICTVPIPHSYLFTIKYDALGNIVWLNTYDGPASTNQQAAELSVDPDNVVYVVANETKYDPSQGRTYNKMITLKIFKTGTTAWIRKDADGTGHGITYDNKGNVLVAASYSPSGVYQLNKFYVVKYSKSGAIVWTRFIDEDRKNGNAYFISTDEAGNVYVNGQTDTIAFYNNPKIITAKYSYYGDLQWMQKEQDGSYTLPDFYGDYTTDEKGNSYLLGTVKLTDYTQDWTVVKRDAQGELTWRSYSDSLSTEGFPTGIGIDRYRNVYITGYSYKQSYYVYTTLGYNPDGVQQWIKVYSRAKNTNNFPIGLGLDKSGNIYVAGGAGDGVCTIKYGTRGHPEAEERGIVSTGESSRFTVFPNPVTDVLFVKGALLKSSHCTYSIYDVAGRLLASSYLKMQGENGTLSINVKDLKAGVYILHMSDGKTNYNQKFSKL